MPRCSLPGRPAARHPRHARAEVCAARGFPTPPLRAPWPGPCQVGTEKGAKNDLTGKAPYKFWPSSRVNAAGFARKEERDATAFVLLLQLAWEKGRCALRGPNSPLTKSIFYLRASTYWGPLEDEPQHKVPNREVLDFINGLLNVSGILSWRDLSE